MEGNTKRKTSKGALSSHHNKHTEQHNIFATKINGILTNQTLHGQIHTEYDSQILSLKHVVFLLKTNKVFSGSALLTILCLDSTYLFGFIPYHLFNKHFRTVVFKI